MGWRAGRTAIRYLLSAIRFPPTGMYYRLSHMLRVPRFFASLRMTSPAGRESRNAGCCEKMIDFSLDS